MINNIYCIFRIDTPGLLPLSFKVQYLNYFYLLNEVVENYS